MFTAGRIGFMVFFVVVFAIALFWAYRRDLAVHQIHFKKSYKVLFALIGFILLMFLIVKIKKYM